MLSDVIAALATPPGRSALAVIRVSGGGAHAVAARVLPEFQGHPARTVRLGTVVHPSSGQTLDQALYVVYHAPQSYTGEDMVEVSVHGGLLGPAEIITAVFQAGSTCCRPRL